ncbi:hypothetical protein [Microbacterium rhizomatis]|uniref:Uncharacterized protein n=1 Tax=Microbacterium rhizomatis TaxID=1631477 RepID=A0A5J5J2T6_9MICO|nr:hypothetical protein [Microbacterium rhizomatis]KAA9110202.1 hypothetical protein F6B43_00380 [Microbacterium rhizomatis]
MTSERQEQPSDEPSTDVLAEPSTEKEPGQEPKGGGADEHPDHEAVGVGVIASEVPGHTGEHVPNAGEPSIPELEDDETIAPRPEEEAADLVRAEPDVHDHSSHPE